MRCEIYKLIKSKVLFFLLLSLFLFIFLFSVIFNSISTDKRNFGYGIESYSDFDVLSKRIADCETELENLEKIFENGEITKEDYDTRLYYLTVTNNIYKCLSENKIKYDDAQTINYLSAYSENRISFMIQISLLSEIFLIIGISVVSVFSFNHDFQIGTMKFTYVNGEPRRKTVLNKIGSSFICYILMLTVCIASIMIFSLAYDIQFSTLIDVTGTEVAILDSNDFIGKIILSVFLDTLCYFIIFTMISLLFVNLFFVLGLQLFVYILFNLILPQIPFDCFTALAIPFFCIFTYDISESLFAIVTVIKYMVVIGLFTLSYYKFLKKDLL